MKVRGNLLKGEARFVDTPPTEVKGMKLKEYIAEHYSGNVSAYAKTLGVRYDQVGRWLKRDCMVIDGKVYCEVSKQVKGK